MRQKRILCINDISCMGKCSLTVALPVISALGIEAVVLPTAILSAHTVFKGYTFTDTTAEMEKALDHFNNMGEKFDCIYTGYLGSQRQVQIVSSFIDKHKESIVLTDPVMGDNGRLYSGFDKEYPGKLIELCKKSHVIIPNLTEACLITNTPYISGAFSERYIDGIIAGLCRLAENAIITGVIDGDLISVYSAERGKSGSKIVKSPYIDRQFHGTGDVFASVLSGFLTLGRGIEKSVEAAVKFTEMCINKTVEDKDSQWYGLRFEECLHRLLEMI